MNNIKEHIKELEERLLHSDVKGNPEILNELIGEDFEEIGSNGKVSSREEVIEWMINKDKNIKWSLNDFRIRKLTPELVIAIYTASKNDQVNSNGSIRSSIWKNCDGKWKMIFHQGTKIIDG